MNIIALKPLSLTITGGNVYEMQLYQAIGKFAHAEIEYCNEKSYPSGFNFTKLICPLLELRLLNKIKNKKICFWNSSTAYRHLLLFIIVRIFYPEIKLYIIHHHYQYEMLTGFKRSIFRFIELSFLRLSTSIVIPSPYVLMRTKFLLPGKKVDFIEIAFKEHTVSLENIDVKHAELLFIGSIEHRKGVHLLLDSLIVLKENVPVFFVNIVGSIIDQNYYAILFDKVISSGLEKHIKFHGRVSSEVLHHLLLHSELLVLPSLLEGYGMVIIEAMSYGIPVIAFNNSAMPFTIKNGVNGFLANNEDVLDYGRLIEKVISNPKLRFKLSQGAFETYKKSRRDNDFNRDVKNFVATL